MSDGESGVVVSLDDDRLIVSMKRSEACAKCRACISGLSEKEMRLIAKNECNAKIGDLVHIELREGVFLRSVLIMYGVPLVFMLFGFVLGQLLSGFLLYINPEILSFFFGVMFLVLSYLLIHRFEHKIKKQKYEPAAVSVIRALQDK